MAKAVVVTKKGQKSCPIGQHQMPNGKCMKDSAMKKAAPFGGAAAPPLKRNSGY